MPRPTYALKTAAPRVVPGPLPTEDDFAPVEVEDELFDAVAPLRRVVGG